MGGRGAVSSTSDRQFQEIYRKKLMAQGIKNIVTKIKNSNQYTDGTIYRQGFRDTSFRITKSGNRIQLIRYELGSEEPETLATGTIGINRYMRKHGLVFAIGG